MLDDLDKELEKRGHKYVRYADDCVRHEARYMHDTKVSAARRGAASLSP
jgi:hypothetical protein